MKEALLLRVLSEAYYNAKRHDNPEEAWVSMERIIETTLMSSFNQRFQEWRERGIEIENRTAGNISEYRLLTNPEAIDWQEFRLKVNIDRSSEARATYRKDPKRAMAEGLQEKLL